MGHRVRQSVPLCVLVAVLSGCDASEPLQGYELSGLVTVRLDTGAMEEGIAGANVTFTSDTLLVEETTTDGTGRYRMRIATDHEFGQVRAEAEGFFPGEQTVYFDAPERRVDVSLVRMP